MARKKVELFINIWNEKEFENALNLHRNTLICAEIYCSHFGSCTCLDRLFTRLKLDWSSGEIVLLKVLADEIDDLKRFWNHSQPVFMFIVDKKVALVFRGVDSIRFEDEAKKEWLNFTKYRHGASYDRTLYELNDPTSYEKDWLQYRVIEKQQAIQSLQARRAARQVARKRHRAERMVPHLKQLNFVLFFPHNLHAHPELYEKWELNNIIMVAREEIELDKDTALDVLYAGDAPINEASLHVLQSGPSLAICFRLLDDDKHFVSLVRKILYEEIPQYDETKPASEQPPRKTAYEFYKTYSPTKEEIYRKRQEERQKKKEEATEKRARRLSEMLRLARQARADALEARKAAKEKQKMDLLKKGQLHELEKLKVEPDDLNLSEIQIPDELGDETGEGSTDEEDPHEYFPPPGLVVPGFYAPPNDVAKANGLALLFPKLVEEHVTPLPEFLPSHVLVLLHMHKRRKAIETMAPHKSRIIHMGIFKATTPYDAVHVAYSVKQYESMDLSIEIDELKLAFMVSVEVDLPLLELMDLGPLHVSRDETTGEDECAAMFRVDYADDYDEFEDFVQ